MPNKTKADLIAEILALPKTANATAITAEELGKLTNAELEQIISNADGVVADTKPDNPQIVAETISGGPAVLGSQVVTSPPADPAPEPLEALRTPGGVTRRKVNRGSTRRINRALENVTKALEEFEKEIDGQVWITDESGERVDAHPIVKGCEEARKHLAQEVAAFTTPV
ncbi:hypothetical protein DVVG_00049 [Dunaliella viridis virus SI2]|uniref:hypothetical protein n=1 Tax=Dunaliella viridis virus SI2 TaxID=754069 RepID=UPI0002C10A7F|nr:hypothetical protein DVVG_00049 [Dunaliella viridis virus SI2]AGH16035.1 hypothetical protein DVVG_00049 [Dunaliella viridis virus SI2]